MPRTFDTLLRGEGNVPTNSLLSITGIVLPYSINKCAATVRKQSFQDSDQYKSISQYPVAQCAVPSSWWGRRRTGSEGRRLGHCLPCWHMR